MKSKFYYVFGHRQKQNHDSTCVFVERRRNRDSIMCFNQDTNGIMISLYVWVEIHNTDFILCINPNIQ